jgi:hypothetical protein
VASGQSQLPVPNEVALPPSDIDGRRVLHVACAQRMPTRQRTPTTTTVGERTPICFLGPPESPLICSHVQVTSETPADMTSSLTAQQGRVWRGSVSWCIRTLMPRRKCNQSVVFGFGIPSGFGLRASPRPPVGIQCVPRQGRPNERTTPLLNVSYVTEPLRDTLALNFIFFPSLFPDLGRQVALVVN